MECKDYKQKFNEINGWEKTSDGREAYSKLFKFKLLREEGCTLFK